MSSYLLLTLPLVGKTPSSTSVTAETQASVSTILASPPPINQSPCSTSSVYPSHNICLLSIPADILHVHGTIFPCLESYNSLLTDTPSSSPAPFQSTLHAHQELSEKQNGKKEILIIQNPQKPLYFLGIKSRLLNRVSRAPYEPTSSL